jgi:hypothetical protein
VAGYFGSSFLWAAAIPALVFGPERAMLLSQDWMTLVKASPESLYLSEDNQSAWATAARWFGGDLTAASHSVEVQFLALAAVGILGSLMLGRLTRRTAQRGRSPQFAALATIGPWMLLIQLLNPLSWRWGSVFVLGIPMVSQSGQAGDPEAGSFRFPWGFRRSTILPWCIIVVLWLLQQNWVVQAFGYSNWTELQSWGIVTFYWLSFILLALW